MARNLDIATLRSFATVIEAGGVTRAASRLNLTQSAVSMQIKRLEDSLDLTLLDRSGRGVSATNEGEQLLSYARRMVALNDEAVDRMVAPRFEGEIAFGVPCDLIYPHVPDILRRFDRDFPRVHIRFVSAFTTRLLDEFHSGKLDVILTTEEKPSDDAETVSRAPLLWYGAPNGSAWTRDPLPYAGARHCIFRPCAIEALERVGMDWRAGGDVDSDEGAIAATAADLSVMTLLEGASNGRLEPIRHGGKLPDLPSFTINLYVAKSGANDNLGREFATYVREAYAA